MPISSGSLVVGTTAVQIDGNSVQPSYIYIRNNDDTKKLYVGNSDITIGNGLPVDKLATMEFDLPPGDALHMVAESGTVNVSWLRITK